MLCWMRLWLWSGRAGRGELSGGQAGLSICLCLYFYTRCAVPATNGVSLNVPNASLARKERGHVPHCWSPVQPLAHQLPVSDRIQCTLIPVPQRFDGRIMDVPVAASDARRSTCILSLFLPCTRSQQQYCSNSRVANSVLAESCFFVFFYFLFVGSAPLRKVISRGSYGANDLLFAHQHCCMQLHLEIHGNMPAEMLPPIGAPFRQLAAKKHLDRRVAISMRSMDVLSVGYQSGRRPYIKSPSILSRYLSMS